MGCVLGTEARGKDGTETRDGEVYKREKPLGTCEIDCREMKMLSFAGSIMSFTSS